MGHWAGWGQLLLSGSIVLKWLKDPVLSLVLSHCRDESHFVEIPDRSLKDYLGYISTWSGFRTYSKTNDGDKLLEDFAMGYFELIKQEINNAKGSILS